jgi:hypothetical protein
VSSAIPKAIIPALRDHLAIFVKGEPGTLVFPGAKGGPLRRGNFSKMPGWPHGAESIGMKGQKTTACPGARHVAALVSS